MKPNKSFIRLLALPLISFNFLLEVPHAQDATSAAGSAKSIVVKNTKAIPWDQISTKASADYLGDGYVVTPVSGGARLHCVFQRLDGEATQEGLWLTSTMTNHEDRFHVMAVQIGRGRSITPLPANGAVVLDEQTVRFERPGLVEEYTVGIGGVSQDFVVTEKLPGYEELKVFLTVSGAHVEATTYGAQLVLAHSGRKIAYNRLHVTDVAGKELPARIEVSQGSSQTALTIVVNDVGARYPLRIDPTFSDANWVSLGGMPGVIGEVHAAAVDGSGNLYIGGKFTLAGNVFATNIAKWDGSGWSTLGSGGLNDSVDALAVLGGNLYAGGHFTAAGGVSSANFIAKWDGSGWSALQSGVNSWVSALAVSGGDLYVGGRFTTASGNVVNHVAKWDGINWSTLSWGLDGAVSALAVSAGFVYAGGDFTTIYNPQMNGGVLTHQIARWSVGSGWLTLGTGVSGSSPTVTALAVSGSDLYAGGQFTTAGGASANNIAKWNGFNWSPLGSGMAGYSRNNVNALAVSGGDLYVGGQFLTAGGLAATNTAKWNGSSWGTLGPGMGTYGTVSALVMSGSNLFAGGHFETAGETKAANIAEWDGNQWSTLGSGLDNTVDAMAVYGNSLYASVEYTTEIATTASRVVKWDGSNWSQLGVMNWPVYALAVSGTDLYAGGKFTTIDGVAATNIAKWDGNSWIPLSSGMGAASPFDAPSVAALVVSGSDLFAGGFFTTAGGVAATNIAKWNGSTWSALGSGIGIDGTLSYVSALAVSEGTLYAGGFFTTSSEVAATNIAKWNGSSWSALGSGMNSRVSALAMLDGTLYAGGYFTAAGGVPASHVAKWNGSSWSALGSGMNAIVDALAVSGSDLYAGGAFTTADGVPAARIAKWNGITWSAIGSGMNDTVTSLALSGGDIFAGGYFTMAGGTVSTFVADAIMVWPQFQGEPVLNTDGSITLNMKSLTQSTNRLYAAPNLSLPVDWQPVFTNFTGGFWQFTDSNTDSLGTKFYRLSTP